MPLLPGLPGGTRSRPGASRPARLAEFTELHDAYAAEVELPGVPENQIRVELAGRDLVISTRRGAGRSGLRAPRRARRAVRLECWLPLPGQADTRHVMAMLADGLLIITVPRQDTASEPASGAARRRHGWSSIRARDQRQHWPPALEAEPAQAMIAGRPR